MRKRMEARQTARPTCLASYHSDRRQWLWEEAEGTGDTRPASESGSREVEWRTGQGECRGAVAAKETRWDAKETG
jgi:hypothetical protein